MTFLHQFRCCGNTKLHALTHSVAQWIIENWLLVVLTWVHLWNHLSLPPQLVMLCSLPKPIPCICHTRDLCCEHPSIQFHSETTASIQTCIWTKSLNHSLVEGIGRSKDMLAWLSHPFHWGKTCPQVSKGLCYRFGVELTWQSLDQLAYMVLQLYWVV